MVPLLGVGINPMMANKAVRMDQLGCQVSGWYPDMERQIFFPTSNRPFGWWWVKNKKLIVKIKIRKMPNVHTS